MTISRKGGRAAVAAVAGLAFGLWSAAAVAARGSQVSSSLPAPQLFAPGVISGPGNDGAPTFTPSGRTLFFERTNGRRAFLLTSRLTATGWSRPAPASFAGPWSDQQPALSPNGRYLVYVSSRAAARGGRAAHLYRVDRVRGGWSAPRELSATVNFSSRVFKPSVAANGDLYFMADVGTGAPEPAKWRLFVSRFERGAYSKAEALPFSDGSHSDVDPAIARDQSYIIFSSRDRPPFADGHEHLFIALREGAGWGSPQPMRYAGDTAGGDAGEANLSPDGRTLFFTSDRPASAEPPETRQQMMAAFARMEVWDNGNSNVWTLPLAPYLAGKRAPTADREEVFEQTVANVLGVRSALE